MLMESNCRVDELLRWAILMLKDIVQNQARRRIRNLAKPREMNFFIAFASRSPNPQVVLVLLQNVVRRLAEFADVSSPAKVLR